MEKYGFVYIWRDRKHKRYYIGCHWGREDDGYICSSNWMRDAYRKRPEDFKRRILKTNILDKKETFKIEEYYFSMIKSEELRVRYYNLNINLKHWIPKSKEEILDRKEKISKTMTNKWQTPEHIEKMKAIHQSDEWKVIASKNALHKRPTRKKKATKKKYKDVLIHKNDNIKIIKQNQVPQYSKFGWLVVPAGFEPT